jgi:hypothetical protein
VDHRPEGVNMPEDNKPENLSTEPSLLWRIFQRRLLGEGGEGYQGL